MWYEWVFNLDSSFSEMRKLYSIQLNKEYEQWQRKNWKEELESVHERKFQNFGNVSINFQFG